MQQPSDYAAVLSDIRNRIHGSRLRAAVAANREMLRLYYSIGMDLSQRLDSGTWGSGIVDRLSADLGRTFPDMKGFSPGNLRRMRRLTEVYPLPEADLAIWSRTVTKSDSG